MPKKIKPTTFNLFLAKVIQARMDVVGISRPELAARTSISPSTLDRNFAGKTDAGWTSNQIARISGVLDISAGKLIDDALENMGGFDALMSEVRNTNDELAKKRQRKQAEAAAMTPQQIEKQKIAATDDPELLEDEPQAP